MFKVELNLYNKLDKVIIYKKENFYLNNFIN